MRIFLNKVLLFRPLLGVTKVVQLASVLNTDTLYFDLPCDM